MIQFAVSFHVLLSRACPLQEGGKAKANSYLIVIPRPLEKKSRRQFVKHAIGAN